MFRQAWKRSLSSLLLLLLPFGASCVSHSHATEFHGVDGVRGVPVEYQTTSVWAMNGLFVFPMWGRASREDAVSDFMEEAAARGAERVRIVDTTSSTWWWCLPPISFFIQPVHSTVQGTLETDALPGG